MSTELSARTSPWRTCLAHAVALAASCICAAPATAEVAPAVDVTPAALSAEDAKALATAAAADAAAAPGAEPTGSPATSSNPALSLLFGGSISKLSEAAPAPMGGHDPQRTGFNLHYLEMFLSSSVDPYLHFQANLVFVQGGVEVEEAFAETLALPANLQLKAGQFLTDFGRINPTHPHAWSFVDQPLMIGKFFGPDGNRGLGAQLAWLAPLPWFVEAKLAVHNADNACCNRSMFGDSARTVRAPDDLLYTATLRTFVAFGEDWSLFGGLSGQQGPGPAVAGIGARIVGGDLYLRYRPVADAQRRSLSLQVEHARRERDLGSHKLVDQVGYAQLVGQFALRWEAGLRAEWGTGLAADPLNPEWTALRTRHALQLSFYPSHFSRVRLQANADNPGWISAPGYGIVLSLETLIGEHGAHKY